MKIPGARNIAEVANNLPGRTEYARCLGAQELRIVINPRRQTNRMRKNPLPDAAAIRFAKGVGEGVR